MNIQFKHWKIGDTITEDSDNIKIEGYRGRWYVIDSMNSKHGRLYLLEHETYGDDTAGLIVDKNGNVIVDDVWNGFEDLEV